MDPKGSANVTMGNDPVTLSLMAVGAPGANPPQDIELCKVELIALPVDTEGPNVQLSWDPQNPTNADQITFRAEAWDPSGIKEIRLDVNMQEVKVCQDEVSCTYVGGPYAPQARVLFIANAEDYVGNWGSADVTIEFSTVAFPSVPNAPTNLRVTGMLGDLTEAYLAFDDNSNDEDGFYVYFNGSKLSLGANQTTFTIAMPSCGVIYDVYVTAYNAAGESAHSNTVGVEGACPPGPPSGLMILEWDQFGGARLSFQPSDWLQEGFHAYADGVLHMHLGPSDTSFFITVPCGETWSIHVTAVNSLGESGPSNTVDVVGQCP